MCSLPVPQGLGHADFTHCIILSLCQLLKLNMMLHEILGICDALFAILLYGYFQYAYTRSTENLSVWKFEFVSKLSGLFLYVDCEI